MFSNDRISHLGSYSGTEKQRCGWPCTNWKYTV